MISVVCTTRVEKTYSFNITYVHCDKSILLISSVANRSDSLFPIKYLRLYIYTSILIYYTFACIMIMTRLVNVRFNNVDISTM